MLLDSLETVLVAAGKQKCQTSFCIWGKHGIGKTQLIKKVAKQLGWGYRNIRLSQVDPTELIGFPTRKKETVTVNDKDETIEYLDYDPPRWFVEAMRGKYIIFLDELNRAKPDTVNAAFELVQERELNGRKLPDDVLIIVACNPASNKYSTNAIFDDEALNDRFCHIKVDSNFDVWKSWAREKEADGKTPRISREIVDYLSSSKSALAFDEVDEVDQQKPFECKPSPRSWEKVENIKRLNISIDFKQELIEGIVGVDHAAGFINSLRAGNKPLTIEEIFEMSEETVEKIKSYSDVVGEGVNISEMGGEKIVEIALLNSTCEALSSTDDEELRKEVQKNYVPVLQFLTLIPPDLAQKTLKKLCSGHQNKKFWNTKLSEEAVDSKGKTLMQDAVDERGNPVLDARGVQQKEAVPRWKVLIDSLDSLANAREDHHERVNGSSSLNTPKKSFKTA